MIRERQIGSAAWPIDQLTRLPTNGGKRRRNIPLLWVGGGWHRHVGFAMAAAQIKGVVCVGGTVGGHLDPPRTVISAC